MRLLLLLAMIFMLSSSCAKPESHGYICTDTVEYFDAPEFEAAPGIVPFSADRLRHDCIYASRWPPEPYAYTVAYSAHLKNLKAGDIVYYSADVFASSGSTGPVLFAWFMETSLVGPDDPNAVADYSQCAAYPDTCHHPGMGFNITSEMHYGTASDTGTLVIEQDRQDLWLNFVVYGGYSNDVGSAAEWLHLAGNGSLSGIIIRNISN